MSYFLFLDDERHPQHVTWCVMPAVDWVVVRDYQAFENVILDRGLPQYVSFDHDLGRNNDGTEHTGLDCAKFLVEWCLDNGVACPDFGVHSLNPLGAQNIHGLLKGFSTFQQQHFGSMKTKCP